MAEGRSRQLWEHTSWILAKLHNGLSGGKRVKPDDFNPHTLMDKKKHQKPPTKEETRMGFAMLKAAFVDQPAGRRGGTRPDEATVAEIRREYELLKAQSERN